MSELRDVSQPVVHVPATPAAPPAPAPPACSIALVGAGPRGTSVLERLCASVPELAPGTPLTVHVVDPAPPGAGQVWRTDQSGELLMNTVASQVTVYTDASVRCAGPIRPGPSLYEWAATTPYALGPDDYPPRALYGRYLRWAFERTVVGAPCHVTVRVHRARAVRLEDAGEPSPWDEEGGPLQELTLSDGTVLSGLGAVVLAQGHLPVRPGPEQARLSAYATRHGLRHIPPANPADLDLSGIEPGEPVLLRGLGLNFFDHMALLTVGRGGTFRRDPDGRRVYHPSGREPRLYAGSRRGVAYRARGDNEKGASERHEALVLTDDVIEVFRKRTDAGDPPDFRREIWPLVAKEVETVYYEALLRTAPPGPNPAPAPTRVPAPASPPAPAPAPGEFRRRFLDARCAAEVAAVLDDFGVAEAERWCWERVERPYGGETFRSPAEHRARLLAELRQDAAEAALGNVGGPVKAALDVLRDIRNELRRIVDHAGLSGACRRDRLDRWYTPLNAFLSIGPPRRRIEEMTALIEAGVLEVVGPRLEVRAEGGAFVARSPDVADSTVTITTLVEARLPEPDLARTGDELLARLLRSGGCRVHTVDGYATGGLDVTERPFHLINRQGVPHARRFGVGVPTEGVHWVTAAGARPGVDSVMLTDTDAVARAALRAAARPSPDGPAHPLPAPRESPERPNVELASIDEGCLT
ncbi:FAD/NAD(P)-binding protein [Streptomyces purpureus]|uniref:FAD/NAD(P)-binding protein n=1 Tax=Streptomyces purpureus TaxID=1951 RepID=UPI000373C45C